MDSSRSQRTSAVRFALGALGVLLVIGTVMLVVAGTVLLVAAPHPPPESSGSGATASDEVPAAAPAPMAARRTVTATAPAPTTAPSVLPSSAIVAGSVGRASPNLRATHDVDLDFDFGTRAVRVVARSVVTNTSGGPIDRLELNLVPARLGRLRLGNVSLDNRTVRATIDDQTLVIPLGGVLPPGASVRVRVVYRATLRATVGGSDWMFTRAGGIAELYRWIPWPSGRAPFERPNHGDPFMTPVSPEVRIRLTTDRPLVVATAARRVSISANRLVQEFLATEIRDVPMSMAPDFRLRSTRVGDTLVRVYGRPGAPSAAMLEAATRALGRMERLL
ncbi:MAG TPA: hypothetical protein VIV06_12085, partial [Candidatus Limnocylindrales bacterium]